MSNRSMTEINSRTAHLGDWRGIDAVVFVHGIGGDFLETWGAFPELLGSDPELPELDILLWGYQTGFLRSQEIHGTETLGHNFISELRLRVGTDSAAHLVAHSMGGLVVLQGLTEEMKQARAQEPPTSAIHFISLFAVPTRGISAVNVVADIVSGFGQIGLPQDTLNDQLRSLEGTACDLLIGEVREQIYEPPTDGPSARRIPIRMVLASRDGVVVDEDRDMAHAPFQAPPPMEFDYGHRDVKLPTSHEDIRYLALARDVQTMVTERFTEISRRCLDGPEEDRDDAETDLQIRFDGLLRRRFVKAGGQPDDEPDLYAGYLRMVMRDCLSRGRPPFDAANRAVMALHRKGFLGRAD